MAVPYQPQSFTAQQADGNVLLSWQGALGALTYTVQRSTDGVNFATIAPALTANQYVDPYPGIGVLYYYQVAGVNATGTGPYSTPAQAVTAPPAELSLYELRLRCRQRADRVDSQFVTDEELNYFIRNACYELYDLLMTTYEDYFSQNIVTIQTNGTTGRYALPDGATNYLGGSYSGTTGTPAPAFYKLTGVDLNVNTSSITPSRVTLKRFDFINRNEYVYPNSTSTIYGVYNMRYRVMGNFLEIIPIPAGNQVLTAHYAPRLPALLKDTDLTTIGVSGWLEYVIVRAAKYMIDKEQDTDSSKLDTEILFLKQRIEQSASNRDVGQADTISETRTDSIYGGTGWGGGSSGGW